MEIKQLKKDFNIDNKKIANLFDMTLGAYQNSTAKKRYENALCNFVELIKKDFDIIPKK